jgi:hypothetical protein
MNPPTPWPPEVPAGENPPPGAILDYYLAADTTYSQARALVTQLDGLPGDDVAKFKAAVEALAPAPRWCA